MPLLDVVVACLMGLVSAMLGIDYLERHYGKPIAKKIALCIMVLGILYVIFG